jgi:hypothetical protein
MDTALHALNIQGDKIQELVHLTHVTLMRLSQLMVPVNNVLFTKEDRVKDTVDLMPVLILRSYSKMVDAKHALNTQEDST